MIIPCAVSNGFEEFVGELLGGLGCRSGFFSRHLMTTRSTIGGYFGLGIGFFHRRGCEVEMGPEHGHVVITTERTYARQEMVEHDAGRVEITSAIDGWLAVSLRYAPSLICSGLI